MKGDIDDLQITYRGKLCRRIAIRPHIRAEGSATQRCLVCGELFIRKHLRCREAVGAVASWLAGPDADEKTVHTIEPLAVPTTFRSGASGERRNKAGDANDRCCN
jgi:hypothetical protein